MKLVVVCKVGKIKRKLKEKNNNKQEGVIRTARGGEGRTVLPTKSIRSLQSEMEPGLANNRTRETKTNKRRTASAITSVRGGCVRMCVCVC